MPGVMKRNFMQLNQETLYKLTANLDNVTATSNIT